MLNIVKVPKLEMNVCKILHKNTPFAVTLLIHACPQMGIRAVAFVANINIDLEMCMIRAL